VEKLLLAGCAELRANPAWSDAQKVIGVAYSPGGHRVDGASHWLVVDDHRPGGRRPAVPPSTRFHQGIYRTKIIPLPVLPVSWLDPIVEDPGGITVPRYGGDRDTPGQTCRSAG
jgi:hypothetical protein